MGQLHQKNIALLSAKHIVEQAAVDGRIEIRGYVGVLPCDQTR